MEEHEDGDDTSPPARQAELVYYYTDSAGQQAKGPCTIAQFRMLWISGHIHCATLVWREGLSVWQSISQLSEVGTALSSLPQPPPPPADLWYYLDGGGRQRGGVTAEQMGMLLRRGEVDGLTSVWRQGMAAWQEVNSIDELRAALVQDDDDDDDDMEATRAAMERAQQVAYNPELELDMPAAPSKAAAKAAAKAAPSLAATSAAMAGGASSTANGGGAGSAGAAAGSTDDSAPAKPKRVRPKRQNKFKADGGSNVYVSGLPEDVTEDELAEAFKVAGLLKVDAATGTPRIRVYRTPDGGPKGDALVSYTRICCLRAERDSIAIRLRRTRGLRFAMRPLTPGLTARTFRWCTGELPQGRVGGAGGDAARRLRASARRLPQRAARQV